VMKNLMVAGIKKLAPDYPTKCPCVESDGFLQPRGLEWF